MLDSFPSANVSDLTVVLKGGTVYSGENEQATVTDIWSNETIIISNSYIRLDRQSEETKRAYALAFDISLDELGLDGDQ